MSQSDEENEKITELEEQIENEPFNYQLYVSLISELRSTNDTKRLQEVRDLMATNFPLPEDQWIEWLDVAEQSMDTSNVISLYERALGDYLSVLIWERYLAYLESHCLPETVRSAYEKAIQSVGLHVADAHKIWKSFRKFEKTNSDSIRKLFHSQLAIPMLHLENVHDEYEAWEAEHNGNTDSIKSTYQKSLRYLKQIKPYEDNISGNINFSQPDYAKLPEWRSYIQFEISQSADPSRINVLYERALQQYFLDPLLWSEYISYLSSLPDSAQTMLLVHHRAVRNCWWSGELWSLYLKLLEKVGDKKYEEMKDIFERAVGMGLASGGEYKLLFDAWADYQFRKLKKGDGEVNVGDIRETMERGVNHIGQYFPNDGAKGKMQRYWARLEGRQWANMEKAVEIFEDVIKINSNELDTYLDYINLLRETTGYELKCREIYKLGAPAVVDWPEKIFESWMNFEREFGTLEDWEEANKVCKARTYELLAIAGEQQLQQQQQQHKHVQRTTRRTSNVPPGKRQQGNSDRGNTLAGKRKRHDAEVETTENEKKNGREQKRTKVEHEEKGKAKVTMEMDSTEANEGGAQSNQEKMETDASPASERTLFAGGLPYAMDEQGLKTLVSKHCPGVKECRIVKNKIDQSKGFGFVEFLSVEAKNKALTIGTLEAGGRTISFQASAERKERGREKKVVETVGGAAATGHGKHPRTYNDNRTIFINNLPYTVTDVELKTLFSSCGEIKDIRLIKDKNQRSKGYAYIEWADDESLNKALALDQKNVKGRPMNVKRSQPPAKPDTIVFSSRPSTTLVPNAVRRKIQLAGATALSRFDAQDPGTEVKETGGKQSEKGTEEKGEQGKFDYFTELAKRKQQT